MEHLEPNTPDYFLKAKINYFGRIKRHQIFEKLILSEGKMKGQRNRGRSKRYWEKELENWMGARVWRVGRTAEDRLMYGRNFLQV